MGLLIWDFAYTDQHSAKVFYSSTYKTPNKSIYSLFDRASF